MKSQRRNILLISVVSLCGACSAPQSSEEPEKVQMKDQAVEEIEEARAERQRAQPQTDRPVEPEEELEVEMLNLEPGQPARASSGLQIHQRSGPPDWVFELDHHGRTTTVSHTGTPLYVEGIAYGHLYVITQLGEAVQVTLRSDLPEQGPLSSEQALEIAQRERQARLGCDGKREDTAALDNGTVALRVRNDDGSTCEIVVGRYTGEVIDL